MAGGSDEDAAGGDGDAGPEGGFAEVVGVAGFAPEPAGEEVFVVFFGFFLLHPGVFLAVGDDFEAEAADVEEEAQDVG